MTKSESDLPGSSSSMRPSERGAIGSRVRDARKLKRWSLAQLSAESGIPQSTLSKFENGTLSLPIDRVFRLGDALGVAVTEMFDTNAANNNADALGRRSVSRATEGRLSKTTNYDRRWLFADLLQKRMFPVVQQVIARNIDEFGPLLKHEGEEFSIVLKGSVEVVTDLYGPVVLDVMDGIYIDSRMGHAYLNVGDGDAIILNVSTAVQQYAEDEGVSD